MTITFMRCNEVTELSELVKHTVKIQITYYNGDDTDTYHEITDTKQIKEFTDYISDEDLPVLNCPNEGRIIFFMDDEVSAGAKNSVAMEFSLSKDCQQVAYMYQEMWQTKRLTSEGIEFLLAHAKK
jgi:hypothetical protein